MIQEVVIRTGAFWDTSKQEIRFVMTTEVLFSEIRGHAFDKHLISYSFQPTERLSVQRLPEGQVFN